MKGEIWKDIEGYEGLYQVSNMGRVKSLERMKWSGSVYYKAPEKIRKGRKNTDGYLFLTLHKDGKRKHCMIHRLVAQAFIENPQNLPEINHKNEDKTDNKVENLEWCSRSYNINYGTRNKKAGETNKNNSKLSKPVFSVDKESGLIMWWQSARGAGRTLGISQSDITQCCKGKLNSAGGHYWFYADDNE